MPFVLDQTKKEEARIAGIALRNVLGLIEGKSGIKALDLLTLPAGDVLYSLVSRAVNRINRLKKYPLLRRILIAAFRRRMPKLCARILLPTKAGRKEAEDIIRTEILK